MKSSRKEKQVQRTGELVLTLREREVYRLLALAKTNKEISSALNITERTARSHVSNVLKKLGLSRRIEILAKDWPESQ